MFFQVLVVLERTLNNNQNNMGQEDFLVEPTGRGDSEFWTYVFLYDAGAAWTAPPTLLWINPTPAPKKLKECVVIFWA